ncbi:MAG TPA: hypothetical protein VKP65_03445 [Rhodothermales bacterium]|nr:hypothetical protein [Rhodothermales bacterium]
MSKERFDTFKVLREWFAIHDQCCVGQRAQVLDEAFTVGSVGSWVEIAASG